MTHGLIAGHERQKQDQVEEKNKLKADNPFFHVIIEVIDKNSGSHVPERSCVTLDLLK